MLLQKITESELEFLDTWYTPRALAECLFSDFDNFGRFEEGKFGAIRLYQLPMYSDEPIIDFKTTAKYHKLDEKETFRLRKNVGEIYNYGARLYGKTLISLTLDISLSALYQNGLKSAFFSIDEKRIRGVLTKVEQAMKYHPIFKAWDFICKYKPDVTLNSKKNYWSLKGVNMTLKGKAPGEQFYQLHVDKMWGDETSFETEEVYKKRRDSGGELGCINRLAAMTNFTRHSIAGKAFFDNKNRNNIINLPRWVNPTWTQEDLEDALKEFGGAETPNFKVFVGGEIIEDGVSEFDMERIEGCYQRKKRLKRFELKKEQFANFENLIVVERPKNAERIFINADVGDGGGGTDITIFSEVDGIYNYLYNIVFYRFTIDEQKKIFNWLIEKLEANIIAIDCGDALGRALCDSFEEKFGKDHVVRYAGASKINTGLELNENKKPILQNGEFIYKKEFMSEWSISRLKILLYEHKIKIPYDYKLDSQLNSVVSSKGSGRIKYICLSETKDHNFSSFRVFAIAEWKACAFAQIPKMKQEWGIGANGFL